jgi:hypothetical protein
MYENAVYFKGFNPQPSAEIIAIRCDINGVTSFVPIDEANADYANIMSLVADNQLTIEPATEPFVPLAVNEETGMTQIEELQAQLAAISMKISNIAVVT